MKQLIAGQFILLALSVASFADTLYVSPQSFIADVIAESESGDVIILEPGLHQGPVIPYGRNLTIGSRFILDGDTSWIAQSILQATSEQGDSSSAAIFSYQETDCKLLGLTIRGATGTFNGWFDTWVGGCIYVDQSNLLIERCWLKDGHSSFGGAIFVSGIWDRNAHLRVVDSMIDSCSAFSWGGGIYATYCTLSVAKSNFQNLTCDVGTAGIDAVTSYVNLDSLRFTECLGGVGGVGFHGVVGNVIACEFIGNATPTTGFANDISMNDFWGDIRGCTFRETDAPWPSVHIGGSQGRASFIGNILENNTAYFTTGTLIINNRNGNFVTHNIFRNNRNVQGGAVFALQDADASIEYNTFVANVSNNPERGSVLFAVTRAMPRFSNNIVVGNVGNCIAIMSEGQQTLDVRNNWWGDASGPYHAELNPQGHGDTLVGDSVTFIPWLTSPPDTTQPTAIRPEPVIPVAGTWDLQSVFPNPFNNAFTVSISGFAGNAFNLSLFNVLGQKIADLHSGPALGGLFSFAVSSELSSGVYFLVAHDEIIQESIKVVLLK